MERTYKIDVHGCDDSTRIEIPLTEAERDTVRKIARAIAKASTYNCQPTMNIKLK